MALQQEIWQSVTHFLGFTRASLFRADAFLINLLVTLRKISIRRRENNIIKDEKVRFDIEALLKFSEGWKFALVCNQVPYLFNSLSKS